MKKENNKKIGLVILGIVVLVGVFYGGIVYEKSQIPTRGNQTFGQNNIGGSRSIRSGAVGKIISKDANSITVQLMIGGATGGQTSGSKIIFLDNNTTISKLVNGTTADLVTGTQVSITGTPNTDGSINAQSVQIRPNIPTTVLK